MRNYGDYHYTCNPHDDYMHVTGYTLRHRDSPHFLWEKHLQCSVKFKWKIFFFFCVLLRKYKLYTVVPLPMLSLCSQKTQLEIAQIGVCFIQYVNVLRYFKIPQLRKQRNSGFVLCSKCSALFQSSVAVKIVQLGVCFLQQMSCAIDSKKFELSYFSHSYAIFPPSYTIFFLRGSVTAGKNKKIA